MVEVNPARANVRQLLHDHAQQAQKGGYSAAKAREVLRAWMQAVPESYRLTDGEIDQTVVGVWARAEKPAPASVPAEPNPPDGLRNDETWEPPPKAQGASNPVIPTGIGLDQWADGSKVSSLRGDDADACHLAMVQACAEAGHTATLAYHSELTKKRTKKALKDDIRLGIAILEGRVKRIDGGAAAPPVAAPAPPVAAAPAPPVAAPAPAPTAAPMTQVGAPAPAPTAAPMTQVGAPAPTAAPMTTVGMPDPLKKWAAPPVVAPPVAPPPAPPRVSISAPDLDALTPVRTAWAAAREIVGSDDHPLFRYVFDICLGALNHD